LRNLIVCILLLSLSVRPIYLASYLGYFEYNLEAMVEEYCVNKNKPQLKCNGKCHLSKKFTNAYKKDNHKENINNNLIQSLFPVVCILNDATEFNLLDEIRFSTNTTFYKNNYDFLINNQEIKPPIV